MFSPRNNHKNHNNNHINYNHNPNLAASNPGEDPSCSSFVYRCQMNADIWNNCLMFIMWYISVSLEKTNKEHLLQWDITKHLSRTKYWIFINIVSFCFSRIQGLLKYMLTLLSCFQLESTYINCFLKHIIDYDQCIK